MISQSESLQTRALVQLRDMILKGEFQPGERLAEVPLAERMGVSRTPVKMALAALEKEGLVESSPSGGYLMRRITSRQIDDAIAVRGHLEGMAARLIAEHGVPRQLGLALTDCIKEGDDILDKEAVGLDDYTRYTHMNDRFHRLVVEGCGNDALIRAIDMVNQMPFAAASALVPGPASTQQGKHWLIVGHAHHRAIVEAMIAGQGTRAQAIATEHVAIAQQNLRYISERPEIASKLMPHLGFLAVT